MNMFTSSSSALTSCSSQSADNIDQYNTTSISSSTFLVIVVLKLGTHWEFRAQLPWGLIYQSVLLSRHCQYAPYHTSERHNHSWAFCGLIHFFNILPTARASWWLVVSASSSAAAASDEVLANKNVLRMMLLTNLSPMHCQKCGCLVAWNLLERKVF